MGRDGWSWIRVGAAVLLIDGILLYAHAMHHTWNLLDHGPDWLGVFRAPMWNGGRDGSLVELFGVFQLTIGAVLLINVATRRARQQVLLAWGGVFLTMAADDLFRLHERAGRLLGPDQNDPALVGGGAQELGGLVFWCLSGLVMGGVLLGTHRASCASARHASVTLATSLLPLTLVAVGYVLISAHQPALLDGASGVILVLVRVTVKLLTMTIILVQAVRLIRGTVTTQCPAPRD